MTDPTPSPEALAAARIWLSRDSTVPYDRPTVFQLALALDAFAAAHSKSVIDTDPYAVIMLRSRFDELLAAECELAYAELELAEARKKK